MPALLHDQGSSVHATTSLTATAARLLAGAPVSHFRGRKLDGLVLELPVGVTGAVMREVPVDTPAKTAVNAGGAGRRALNNYRPGAGPSSNYGIHDEEEEDMGFGAGGYGGSDDDDDDLRDMLARRRGSGTNADVPTPSDAASAHPKRAWVVDATFSRITEWQHDRPVTDNDLVPAALEWIELARVLHS